MLPVDFSRSKDWVWGRSLTGTADSNPAGDMVVCLLQVSCVVRYFASGWSLVRRSPTECGVPECYLKISTM